jgi:hypothetical protein
VDGGRTDQAAIDPSPFRLGVNYWPRRKAMAWWSAFDAGEVRPPAKRVVLEHADGAYYGDPLGHARSAYRTFLGETPGDPDGSARC